MSITIRHWSRGRRFTLFTHGTVAQALDVAERCCRRPLGACRDMFA
jgi:hypothetical protein